MRTWPVGRVGVLWGVRRSGDTGHGRGGGGWEAVQYPVVSEPTAFNSALSRRSLESPSLSVVRSALLPLPRPYSVSLIPSSPARHPTRPQSQRASLTDVESLAQGLVGMFARGSPVTARRAYGNSLASIHRRLDWTGPASATTASSFLSRSSTQLPADPVWGVAAHSDGHSHRRARRLLSPNPWYHSTSLRLVFSAI